MIREILKYTFIGLLLVIAQVFIVSQLPLTHYIRPQLYIYLILIMPFTVNIWGLLISSFLLGAAVDSMTDTLGMAAAATVLMAMIRWWLNNRINTDSAMREGNYRPSSRLLGRSLYLLYIAGLAFIHHFYLFSLEYFDFSRFFSIFFTSLMSTLGTTVLVVLSDVVFDKGKF